MNVTSTSSIESVGSVGSITSKLAATRLEPEPSPDEMKQKLDEWKETCDKLSHDAARWNFAKCRMYKQLGYTSPIAMQADVDEQMGTTK